MRVHFEEERDGVLLRVLVLSTEVVKSYPNSFKNFSITPHAFLNSTKKADEYSTEYFKIETSGVKIENLDNEDEYFVNE